MTDISQPHRLVVDHEGNAYALPLDVADSFRLTGEDRQALIAAAREGDTQGFLQTYTVQPGDSLWSISQRLYGNGAYWPMLFGANAGSIRNPNLIYPGQTLVVG